MLVQSRTYVRSFAVRDFSLPENKILFRAAAPNIIDVNLKYDNYFYTAFLLDNIYLQAG